jgi:hypothetical protein
MSFWQAAVAIVIALGAATQADGRTAHASGVAPAGEIHAFGQVNVNEASPDELSRVPGLRKADVDRILRARTLRRLQSLRGLLLSRRVARYLTTDGPTDLAVVRKLPLERAEPDPVDTAPAASAAQAPRR